MADGRTLCEGHSVSRRPTLTARATVICGRRSRTSSGATSRFAVGTGLLIRSDRCRATTEAYVDQKTMEGLFDKLRGNGADVKYVTMDEPFFYGHRDSGPTSCHESPQVLAQALKESIAIVRKYFPNAKIGSDEVGMRPDPGYKSLSSGPTPSRL